MECLKLLSRHHKLSIITSIHQPNNEILMMFDKLFVLAKGGVCVYSGFPQYLSTYLRECDIICSEFQVPIEVLLKVSSRGIEDEQVIKMSVKTSKERESILNRCKTETKLFPNGIPFESKSFKFIDLWYLLMRTIIYSYISQWKSFVTQMLFYIFYPIIIAKMYNSDIGAPNGCFSFLFESNTSCFKDLEDHKLLDQNTKYINTTSVFFMFIQLTYTILTFPREVKIFLNEHQNSKFSNYSHPEKNLISNKFYIRGRN
jgi:hypothetical protein